MTKLISTPFLLSFAAVTISCAGENTVGPDTQSRQPQKQGIPITSVRVTALAYTALIGSTVKMTAVVSAENGVRYTVEWSLKEATNAATIDARTGMLTAIAPGFAYPRACATATMPDGQTRTLCDQVSIRIVAPFTPLESLKLAFVRNGTIFVPGPDKSEPVALIPEALRPSWSPDGTRIAFTRPASNQLAIWQLCIAKQDGSDIRCASGASNGVVLGKPSWSPDGSTVAFSVFNYDCPNGQCGQLGGNFSGLSLLDTNTMQIKVLKTPPVTSASWSPDGRKIAIAIFGIGTFGRGALATVNPDGSGLNYLAMSLDTYSVREVSWSPDGSRLALSLEDENACPWYCDTAIGIVNADGTQLKVLDRAHTCFGSGCGAQESYIWGSPEWVGNSGRVAYTITRGGECYIDERAPCGTDVLLADVDDGRLELLVSGGGFPSSRQ